MLQAKTKSGYSFPTNSLFYNSPINSLAAFIVLDNFPCTAVFMREIDFERSITALCLRAVAGDIEGEDIFGV